MSAPFQTQLSDFTTCLIEKTVQTVLEQLAQAHPVFRSVFDTKQAAQYLSASPSFLNRLRSKGKGPPYIQIESAIRYQRIDIDAWLSNHVMQPKTGKSCEGGQPNSKIKPLRASL